jgi:hypothetical protein
MNLSLILEKVRIDNLHAVEEIEHTRRVYQASLISVHKNHLIEYLGCITHYVFVIKGS